MKFMLLFPRRTLSFSSREEFLKSCLTTLEVKHTHTGSTRDFFKLIQRQKNKHVYAGGVIGVKMNLFRLN